MLILDDFLRLKPSISVDSFIELHSYAKEFCASALLRSKVVYLKNNILIAGRGEGVYKIPGYESEKKLGFVQVCDVIKNQARAHSSLLRT